MDGKYIENENVSETDYFTRIHDYLKSCAKTKEVTRFYIEPYEKNRIIDYQQILNNLNNMPPQGFVRHSRTLPVDLFSLPVPAVRNRGRKRNSKELNLSAPEFKRRETTPTVFIREPEIITIDSDNDVEKEVPLVTLNDSSDNESVKIYEPENKTVKQARDSNTDNSNLIININQTENVDKIVDSALGRLANGPNSNVMENGNVAKRSNFRVPVHDYPKSWTKEMIRFYTEPCEKNRVFDYQQILNNLKTKPSDWWISRADLVGSSKRKRSFEICRKCDKYGHTTKECSRNFVCYMCGQFNHRFPNCPNTLCLNCGKPASKNLMRCHSCDLAFRKKQPCGLCKQISHEEFMCPSKWRKHLLLESSNQTLRVNTKRCCYNCAQEGHFGFECPLTQNSPYPLENPLLTACIDYTTDKNNNNVIFVSEETADLLSSEMGNALFERLSKNTKCRIESFRGVQNYVRIVGDEHKVRVFKDELEKLKCNAR